MTLGSATPPHNIAGFRLRGFIGRQTELAHLANWLRQSPVVAVTGFSGIGKSSLVTALATQLMSQFDEGLVWVTAYGTHRFRIYDIIRAIEDVLATGITSQPPDQWEILAVQQLYGRRRLIILDEITQASEKTIERIAETIGRIGPGGPGRVVLIGRELPPPLAELAGDYHLKLGGLAEPQVRDLVTEVTGSAPTDEDLGQLFDLSLGHPLAIKLLAPVWTAPARDQAASLHHEWCQAVTQHPLEAWDQRFEAMVDIALEDLEKYSPAAGQLLTRFTLSSGGGDFDAVASIYWRGLGPQNNLEPTLAELTRRGLLQHDSEQGRYLLHPALRRQLASKRFNAIPPEQQRELAYAHAQHYVTVAREYERTPPHQWGLIGQDWANVRQGVEWCTQQLEHMAGAPAEDLLARIDSLGYLDIHHPDELSLLRDYALALRTYCVQRQPPSGFRWLAAGLVAAQALGDAWSRTLIGGRLSTLAYLQGKYDLADTWLRRSLNALIPVNDKARLSRIWTDLGVLYKAQGKFEEAIAACQQAQSLNESMANWAGVGLALTRIGSIYYAREDLENALAWHRRALALFEEHGDLRGQAVAHNNIGLACETSGNFEQAVRHYQESARLQEALNNAQGMITAYGNLGSVSYELGDFRAAIDWYQKDLAVSEQLGDWTGTAATLHNMGHVALEMGDLAAARDYFSRSRDLYARFGLTDFVAEEEQLLQIVQERQAV